MNGITRAHGTAQERLPIKLPARFRVALPPIVLFAAALVVARQYAPFTQPLTGDPGIFAYISQLVAQGLAPHKYAFNEQASLTYLVGGASMWLGDRLGLHHLVSFRLASLFFFAATAILTYWLASGFTRSRWIGFLAGAILIGFEGLGARASTALEPKAFMLVFGLAGLLLLQRRKWFWAGALTCAAGLAWQIAWGYLLVALLLAFVQGGKTFSARARALAMTLGAALLTFASYTLYFVAHSATPEMLEQTFLAPLLMHSVAARSLMGRLSQLTRTFALGYNAHIAFGIAGAFGLAAWLVAHLCPWELYKLPRRAIYFFLQNRRTAGTLLAVLGFGAYSFVDFQNYPDWIPLLPFLSLFAAWLLWQACATALNFFTLSPRARQIVYAALALVVLFASIWHAFTVPVATRRMQNVTWQMQQAVADDLNQRLGAGNTVWIVGKTELLFFMQRQNLIKYIYFFGNTDAAADAFEPGGFQTMYADALAQKPALLVLARLPKRKFSDLAHFRQIEKSMQDFVPLARCKTIGAGHFLVQPALADALFPKNAAGCIKRQ